MESSHPQGPPMTQPHPHQPDPRTASKSGRTLPAVLGVTGCVLFAAGLGASLMHAPALVALGIRCTSITLVVPFALRRRSLLVWTFLAMLAGAELGVDAPQFASQTHFLGEIFLRLIRMIVAPLIFGGIVTGIAGHNELRGVGRVVIKALIFFEVVTTFGLILGAVAIDLTQAGTGVTLPAVVQAVAPV